MANDRPDASSQSILGRRLWWLIIGRAAAVIVLFLIATAWRRIAPGVVFVKPGSSTAPLVLTVVGLTILYTVARLTWNNFLSQARLQFFFDVLLVTWLVWITGIAASPYAALYIVIIAVAGFFLESRDTMITSVGSAAAFTACALLTNTRGMSSE